MTERYDFFISYVADDKAWAEWIALVFEVDGCETSSHSGTIHSACGFIDKAFPMVTSLTLDITDMHCSDHLMLAAMSSMRAW